MPGMNLHVYQRSPGSAIIYYLWDTLAVPWTLGYNLDIMEAFRLNDSRLDPTAARLSAYFSQLFILAGKEFLQYAVLDTEKSRFIAFADYTSVLDGKDKDAWQTGMESLFTSDEFLHRNYPAVLIAVDTPYHTVIPSALSDAEHSRDHLELNFNLPSGLAFRSDHLRESGTWNTFGIEREWLDMMKKHFAQEIILHRTTPLLTRFALMHRQAPGEKHVFLNFLGKRFDLAAYADNMLLFFNTFQFETGEDVLYFTLYALEQIKLRSGDVKVKLGGAVEETSGQVSMLSEYFPEVGFMDRPELFGYSPLLDFPAHRYQALFSLALCGS
jgi:hypothetical protein